MANPRTLARIAARIQERAAYCLQFEIRDPRAGFITVTRVEVSPDLAVAKVFWSVLGDGSELSKATHMLDHACGFIQRQVTRVLHMRRAPTLRFVHDESLATAEHLDRLIRAARERDRSIDPTLAEREAAAAAEPGAGDDEAESAQEADEVYDPFDEAEAAPETDEGPAREAP